MTEKEAIDNLKNLFSNYELTLPNTDSLETLQFTIKALEEVREYRSLEEQGLFFQLPFAVGDIVYWVADAIYPFEVKEIRIDAFGFNARFAYRGTDENKRYWEIVNSIDIMGEKVFLTREEAEAALERMKGGK